MQYFRAPLNQEVVVAVKPDMMTTSDGLKGYDPHRRQCFFPKERALAFFQSYTQQNCEVECLTNYTRNKCGCVAFHMPRRSWWPTGQFCKIFIFVGWFSDEEGTEICGVGSILCMFEAQSTVFHNCWKFFSNDWIIFLRWTAQKRSAIWFKARKVITRKFWVRLWLLTGMYVIGLQCGDVASRFYVGTSLSSLQSQHEWVSGRSNHQNQYFLQRTTIYHFWAKRAVWANGLSCQLWRHFRAFYGIFISFHSRSGIFLDLKVDVQREEVWATLLVRIATISQ